MVVVAWAAVLAWMVVAAAISARMGRWQRAALSVLVATAVLAVTGLGLLRTATQVPPWLEATSWWVPEQASGSPLGGSADNQVVLDDPYTAPWHARIAWEDGQPRLRNVSATHRIEVDGNDLNRVAITVGTGLRLGDQHCTVQELTAWPAVTLDCDGEVQRVRAPLVDAGLLRLPVFGDRYEAHLGTAWERVGLTFGERELDPGGPRVELVSRGGEIWLGHPTPQDRSASELQLDDGTETEHRLAERWQTLAEGQELTLGFTRYAVHLTEGGLRLEALEPGRRHTLPREAALVSFGEPEAGAQLDLPAALEPPPRLYLVPRSDGGRDVTVAAGGYAVTEVEGGLLVLPSQALPLAEPLPWRPGETLTLVDGVGHGLTLTWRGAFHPLSRGFGAHDPFASTWAWFGFAGLLWWGLTGLLAVSGHARGPAFAFVHGVGLLGGMGLVVLFQITAHVDSVRLPDVAGRHAALLAVAVGLGLVALGVGALLRRAGLADNFWERPLAPLPGLRDLPRAWWLWGAALGLLVVQLPFGEGGIAVPGLSLQPVEAVKVLLLVFLAWYTARARDDKERLLRDGEPEGLALRWRYKVHAVPIALVAGLSFVLDDLSPILMLGALVAMLYVVSWVRPEQRLRRFWDAWWFELAVWSGLAAVSLWGVGLTHSSAARRVLVWADPWRHSATATQLVQGWWGLRAGGWLGTGVGTAPVGLPPAAQDDFILVVLGQQLGLAGLTLWLATWLVVLGAGVWAVQGSPGRGAAGRRRLLYGLGALWLLALQVAVNAGSVSGLLPVMGQPLPLMSAGGSHLLLCIVPVVALVLLASRREARAPRAPAPDWQPAPLSRSLP